MNPTPLEGTLLFGLVFWVTAGVAVLSSLLVVALPNLFRAALSLVVTFLAVAGLFVLLGAEFLGVAQVLIYAGAVSILLLFALVLTRDVHRGNPASVFHLPALFVAGFLLASLTVAVVATDWRSLYAVPLPPEVQEEGYRTLADSAPVLGGLLVREFALPFLAASAVLLAALVGAIALVQEHRGEGGGG